MGFDLRETSPKEGTEIVRMAAKNDATAELLLRWLRLDFGDGIVFENRPPQKSSWDPHLHILPEPLQMTAGQLITFEVSHNRDRLFIVPVPT